MQPEEEPNDLSIRPSDLEQFIGQGEVVGNLRVYLQAAQLRGEALDHILFSGPPGLGKTTLARILSEAQRANFHQVSAPNLTRPGDLAKMLTTLEKKDIMFIDEIHRLPSNVEEVLYSAMEDKVIDITMAEGMGASTIQIDLPEFTLVGATTRPGSLSAPLRDRFGIHLRLDFYEVDDLVEILKRASDIYKIHMNEKALQEIARRARRTPRIALRLLRRIWDYALVDHHHEQKAKEEEILPETVVKSFKKMGVDDKGLTKLDNEFLRIIAENYSGGPVGLKPLAAVLAEDLITLEDFVEPYLVRLGFVKRTPRGRMLDKSAYQHLKISHDKHGLFSDLD